MCDGPDTGYSLTDDREDDSLNEDFPLPMRVDPENSAQNAFVQQWLSEWRDRHVTKERIAEFHGVAPDNWLVAQQWKKDYDCIEGTIEDIQGSYNYEDHQRNTHTFSDKFPTIYYAELHTQSDKDEEGYGNLRVSGIDEQGRRVWIELHLLDSTRIGNPI